MELPRTPSPPPPPPSPPEVLEPMDLSSDRPIYPQLEGDPHSPERNVNNTSSVTSSPSPQQPAPHQSPENGPDGATIRQNQVGTALLRGVPIVSLYIDNQERLCLAQISNTLLKNYSYNEIHNRRVALGITCVQCTPVQLEILRRTGAMPISSRRCGMITKREAERLVKSFLEEHAPPKLPENFAFKVRHTCGWGCKGNFLPSRYNSSRAKCIKCCYCGLFFSPNKFIFHFHRSPDAKYRHPDAANFNSWRRHLDLDHSPTSEDLIHAWEDVKAMFNGGSRKRLLPSHSPTKSGAERRPRLSLAPPAGLPGKLPHQPPCAVFPPVAGNNPATNHNNNHNNNNNNMANMFPQQQSPYRQLPLMAQERDGARADGRRMCFEDLWRPHTSLSYYNPLGLMWAKNFSLYPTGVAPPHPTKQEVLRESVLRMSGMFMDMNGNKPAPLGPDPRVPPDPRGPPADSRPKNKANCRTSAFRPVGNFSHCTPLSPNDVDFNMPVFPRPAMSTSSERSDEYSETLADVDDDVDDDEEVDVDVGDDVKDGESESELSLANDVTSEMTHAENIGGATFRDDTIATKTATPKRDHVTSFSIDSIFDTKKDNTLQNSVEDKSPIQTGTPSVDNSPKPDSDCLDQPENISYILNLSKEELQSELLKLMESREKLAPLKHSPSFGQCRTRPAANNADAKAE